jgi:hypothetical protein
MRPRGRTISVWTLGCVRADREGHPRSQECFIPGNFITNATVRPSHGQPSGHCLTVRPQSSG